MWTDQCPRLPDTHNKNGVQDDNGVVLYYYIDFISMRGWWWLKGHYFGLPLEYECLFWGRMDIFSPWEQWNSLGICRIVKEMWIFILNYAVCLLTMLQGDSNHFDVSRVSSNTLSWCGISFWNFFHLGFSASYTFFHYQKNNKNVLFGNSKSTV